MGSTDPHPPEDENDDTQEASDFVNDFNQHEALTALSAKVKVVFHDDDQTPADFVYYLLETFLGYDEAASRELVQRLATEKQVVAAELVATAAELAMQRITRASQESGYPFKASIERQS